MTQEQAKKDNSINQLSIEDRIETKQPINSLKTQYIKGMNDARK